MKLFWNIFRELKASEEYYKYYAIHSGFMDRLVSVLCASATAGSAIAWWATGIYPPIWATAILVVQVVALVNPILPFSQRTSAANNIHRELVNLTLDAQRTWFSFHTETTDFEAEDLATEFRARLNDIELKYAVPSLLPVKNKMFDLAKKEADTYLQVFYDEEEQQDQA